MNASKILSRIFLSAGLGLAGLTAGAGVVNVATDGNDETGDGSVGAPFATVMRALEAAGDGDTVQIADGTYGERNISVTKAVTVRGNASDRTRVLFDAQKAGRVFVVNDPNAVLADLSVANAYLDQVDAISVTLDGHTATGVGGASLVLTQGTATNCVFAGGDANWESAIGGNVFVMRGLVVGCRLDGGRTAGYGANAYMFGGRLSRCEIVNGVVCSKGQGISLCSSAAVHAWPEMGDAVVDNCLISGNKCLSTGGNNEFVSTIYVGGTGSGRMIVANCTIVDNLGSTASWQRCLRVRAESGRRAPLVVNTVLFNNGGTAETEWDGSLSTLSCAHNCASTVAMEGSVDYVVLPTDASEVFISASDFHPCPGSALLGAGVAGDYDQYVGDVDLDGRPRLKDNGVTLGCYELLGGQLGGLMPSKRHAGVDETIVFRVVTVDDVTGWRFRWTFGDGSPVIETDGPTTSHAYSSTGVYDPSVSLSTDGGVTWSESVSFKGLTVSERPGFYVATTGDDVSGDGTEENPVATIGKGIALASADKDRLTVYVAEGTYAEFGLTVSYGITIRGAGRDKTIVDGEEHGRVFYVDHPSAVLADLTIRNGKTTTTTSISKDGISASSVAGANVCLVDGMVTNCVLKDGFASQGNSFVCGGNAFVFRGTIVDSRLDGGKCDGLGAGAYMFGGRLSRCEIVNGVACPNGVTPANCGSAAVHAWADASDAIIENCLIVSNKCLATGSNGGYAGVCDICGTDNHAMILVNCTIADNLGSTVNWEPCIRVVSHANRKQPKLINCLLFNNGNTAWLEWGNARSALSCFHNCAAAVAIPGGENCTLIPTTDAAKVFVCGGKRPFEPAHKSALCGNGSAAAYADYAVATKDVYGKKRFVGDSIDIGCAERQGPGFSVIVQ